MYSVYNCSYELPGGLLASGRNDVPYNYRVVDSIGQCPDLSFSLFPKGSLVFLQPESMKPDKLCKRKRQHPHKIRITTSLEEIFRCDYRLYITGIGIASQSICGHDSQMNSASGFCDIHEVITLMSQFLVRLFGNHIFLS